MIRNVYHFEFADFTTMQHVEDGLRRAIVAVEALHGRAAADLDTNFYLDAEKRRCVVDAETEIGRHMARIFIGFLYDELGEGGFTVKNESEIFEQGPPHLLRTKRISHAYRSTRPVNESRQLREYELVGLKSDVRFQAKSLWWKPLWMLACFTAELDPEPLHYGYAVEVPVQKNMALRIADALDEVLDDIEQWHYWRERMLRNFPETNREDFDREAVEKFAKFCRESGGFQLA